MRQLKKMDMPCRPCQARREMIAAAKAKNGIKGVVKVLPAVGRHMLTNPPKRTK